MQNYYGNYTLLLFVIIFISSTVYAQSPCTEFNVPLAAPQVVCPAAMTVLISTSSTPTACSASATFQIPYQKNPFSSTGITQAADGTWTDSGVGEWGECYYGSSINNQCAAGTPIRGQHGRWECCDALKAEWIGNLNDNAPDGSYFWSITRVLDFDVFNFQNVRVISKLGVDNTNPVVRCVGGGFSDTVAGTGGVDYTFPLASGPAHFFPDLTSTELNCFKATSGTGLFEYTYENTGGPHGIIVNSFGNPDLKVTGFTDSCGTSRLTLSHASGSVFALGTTTVTATVTDADNMSAACSFTITVVDDVAPTLTCSSFTAPLDSLGQATITPANVGSATDNCAAPVVSATPLSFTCSNLGSNSVTVTSGSSSCTSVVTVTDPIVPSVQCNSFNAVLDRSGSVTVTAADVVTATDNCPLSTTLSGTTTFTCNDAGTTPIVMAIVSDGPNTVTCGSLVSVQDRLLPTMRCKATYTATLTGTPGAVTLSAGNIDSGSTDNCVLTYTLSKSSFTCDDTAAPVRVFLTGSNKGPTGTCSTLVTIQDATPPTMSCKGSHTVTLSASGTGSVFPNDINTGSTDDCTLTFSVSPSTLTCAHALASPVNVVLTGSNNGPSGTCTTPVTVLDSTKPTALCKAGQSYTLSGTTWTVTPDPLSLDGGSSDACGIQSRTVTPSTFTLADYLTGATKSAQLTVKDPSGNTASCTTSITLTMPSQPFLQMPLEIPLYVSFTIRWPVLSFFPAKAKTIVKIVHPSNSEIFQTAFSGDYDVGKVDTYAVNKLNPYIKYNVEVTIGSYPKFIATTLYVKIR